MQNTIIDILWVTLALATGGVIGLSFGLIQDAALRRNEKLQQSGKFHSGWAAMPGSGRRVAYLLIVLALVQFLCPLLFVNGIQWWVSAGVVGGYAWVLVKQLRQKLANR